MKSLILSVCLVLSVASLNAAFATGRGYQLDQLAAQQPSARIGSHGRTGGLVVASKSAELYRNHGMTVATYVQAIDNAIVSVGASLPNLSTSAKTELYLSVIGTEPQVDSATISSIMSGLELSHSQAASVALEAKSALSAN